MLVASSKIKIWGCKARAPQSQPVAFGHRTVARADDGCRLSSRLELVPVQSVVPLLLLAPGDFLAQSHVGFNRRPHKLIIRVLKNNPI